MGVRRIRQNLEEAAFFLDKVREQYFDVLDENGVARPFLYYVSTFVSAARSVAWVMRAEDGFALGFGSRLPGNLPGLPISTEC